MEWNQSAQEPVQPPSPSQEKIHHILINENIIFWRWKETDQFEILLGVKEKRDKRTTIPE